MLLIWGITARFKTLEEGTFYCPHEGGDRPYRLREDRLWFTLFFIPLIPLKVLGTFIECASCQSSYDEAALTMPTAAAMMDNLANAMRQAVVSMITADGRIDDAEKDIALAIMQRYTDTPYTMRNLEDDLKDLKHGDLARRLEPVAGMLNDRGKESLLAACIEIASADGSIDDDELATVRAAGAALGMSPAHVKGVIAHARENLTG